MARQNNLKFAILHVSALAEHRQDRLREERGEAQHGDGVGAGEPQLRPEEVEVERIGERVEEAHAQEERRDLGKEQLAHGELFFVFEARGDKEGAEHALNCLKRVVLRRPEAGDPRMLAIEDEVELSRSLLLAGALALVAIRPECRGGLKGDDGADNGEEWHDRHDKIGHLLHGNRELLHCLDRDG